jgi:hypothetical protein
MTRATLGRIDRSRLFSGGILEGVSDAPLENLKTVLNQIDRDLPVAQKISYVFLNELFRKRAFYALAIQRTYAVVRLPFLDDDFLGLLVRAPMRLRTGHTIHRDIIERYRPHLLRLPLTDTRARLGAGRLERLIRTVPYGLLKRLGFYRQDMPEDYLSAMGDSAYFKEVLLADRVYDRGLVNEGYLREMVRNYANGDRSRHHLLNMLAMVELWYEMFVD